MRNGTMGMMAAAIVAMFMIMSGCAETYADPDPRGDPPSYEYAPIAGSDAPQCVVLGIWVQDDPDLSPTLAVDGCDMWSEVDAICCMSAPRETANIRIYANPQLCPPAFDENGEINGSILAMAYQGQGTVVVNTDCLWRPFGPRTAPSAEQYRNMIAHEIGHVLGLWDGHVPRQCTDAMGALLPETPIHPSGAPICGPAIMNPGIDAALSGLTGPDILHYDRRNTFISVLPIPAMTDMASLGAPSCSLIAPIP